MLFITLLILKCLFFTFFMIDWLVPFLGAENSKTFCTSTFIVKLKPSLSTKILSINDFITKLLSKLLRDFSNKVHLKSISKFINTVINRQCFCR